MASFDAVNFALRPNKGVERRLVFSGLREIDRVFDLANHRYVGLGSLWFVDFVLAHRWLGIGDMVSIEGDEIGYRRAQFNQPLRCIRVLRGETTAVLPGINYAEKPSLVWLDYDSGIGGPALKDIEMVLPNLRPGSIFIITLSAKTDDLPGQDALGATISRQQALREIVGDLLPADVPNRRFRRDDYPRLVAEIVGNQFKAIHLGSARPDVWVELFDIVYSDSTQMVTVGGMVVDPVNTVRIEALVQSAKWTGRPAEAISLPPLTLKEKIALDRLMPSPDVPSQQAVDELGFMLRPEQIRAYHRYYKDFPIYGEMIS